MSPHVSPNHLDWSLGFTRQPNVLAHEYWKTSCHDQVMPARADLDPVAMKKFTPHVGIVELRPAEPGTDYFIRRAGSRWEDVYGPMTGKCLQEFLPDYLVPSWREVFDAVVAEKKPVRLNTQVDFKDKSWLMIEMLIAPLGEHGTVNMLLTCFVSWSKHAR